MSLTDIRLTDYQAGYRQAEADAQAKLAAAEAGSKKAKDYILTAEERWENGRHMLRLAQSDLAAVEAELKTSVHNGGASLKAWRKAEADKKELFKTVAFFASVIKSGEPWSETCEAELAKHKDKPITATEVKESFAKHK